MFKAFDVAIEFDSGAFFSERVVARTEQQAIEIALESFPTDMQASVKRLWASETLDSIDAVHQTVLS